ncbi:hypothetical protein ACFQV2_11715 [Actinokineospora soli]|uniref:Uncharacterized protein n=1 Tax=Actinokineospora soli TaxID=1048753 RepID=A0ABW2TKR2_9PSEU
MAIALSARTAQANTEAPFVVKGLTATARDGSENPFAARIVFQAVDGTHLGSRFEGSKNGAYPKAEAHGAITFS